MGSIKSHRKKFPQILSNGCKYYRNDYNYKIGESNFNFKDKPEFAYYEDQFKAYMGEENVGGKIKCRKRKIKCRIFATNYLSFNLKLKL